MVAGYGITQGETGAVGLHLFHFHITIAQDIFMVNHSKVGTGISFSNLKILDYGLKRYAERTRKQGFCLYKRHFCVAKCLLGCAQTPFVLHRADAGCAFVLNTFITKKIA